MRVGFIGTGAISEAILSGMLNKGVVSRSEVAMVNRSDTHRLEYLQTKFRLNKHQLKREAIIQSDVIILAVKPKDAHDMLTEWGALFQAHQKVISVIGGVTTSYIESFFTSPVPLVRSMPNTSAAVGQSATALCQGKWASRADVNQAIQIFQAVGSVITVTEDRMDAVTGLSGSGPAYFYYMVEAMEKAGVEAGLDAYTARDLTIQTLWGAAHMLVETRKEPATLRREITSEGGTTMAGLKVFQDRQLNESVTEAVLAARDRAEEMGKSYTLTNKEDS